ncbi:MATE family efflux transporter [Brevundimonas aveniformis]|uniref:MATE family efflux transporter n=1 Tax=Brevundimonas aveniformis TaxID=370977 RepID=UPI000429B31F|nr:MATE family efflux transporter [Brevundimonas aveniformis]
MTEADPKLHPSHGLGELLRLAWPVVLSRLGIMTMGLTDAIVVGRYSSEELAFHALGWAPTSVLLTTAVGLLMGVQVMTARLIGAGRPQEVGAVLRRGISYSLQIGLVSVLVLVLAGPWGMHRIGIEPDLADGASAALIIFSLSLPMYLVSVACQFFLEGLERPTPGMNAMWVANGVNLALNLWLVPGLSGLPVDGAVASAWATFFARASLAVFLVVYIWRMADARALGVFSRESGRPEDVREQRKVGYAAGASYCVEVSAFAALTLVAGLLGSLGVAAWTVVLNVSAMVFMVPLGLSAATGVLVSNAYGRGDPEGVQRAGWTGVAVVGVLAFVIALVVWPAAGWISSAYTREPAVLAVAAAGLALATLFFVADALQVVAAQALRSAADVWWPTLMHLFSYGVVMVPLGYALAVALDQGVAGLVWACIIASLISAALLCGRFRRVSRRRLQTPRIQPSSVST